ncbi:cyanocobalamin reductase / alkylcobalamin dealkylase-like [Dreissena polymorpha]|uniref:Cyanocobalamin reductase (cyanide-eliminating) n=1 Tax=Dreissena polymorpha TaxID=45954 RepID=A0A9D4EBE9_DREPO|nr:cyanocobalamin reductase / alkylcobalamin dealkylase-like [Dreissena polymorpha]KAH3775661.1 hypothetical protein DPMN_177067 [Dreissena polymorpha]
MYVNILSKVAERLAKVGLETHPFKIGWYNEHVGEHFKFPLDYDTFALLVISTPDMFENGLWHFILREECTGTQDMLDTFLKEQFSAIKQMYADMDIEAIHDFEMLPNHRPRVLVQTAGHVSGAAYFYQQKDVHPNPWGDKKLFGVSIHPKYGGWFALRGVLIFKNVQCAELPRLNPPDCVQSFELRKELLERFNDRWQDWSYRDIIPVEHKYSERQKQYFGTLPKDRKALIEKWKAGGESHCNL